MPGAISSSPNPPQTRLPRLSRLNLPMMTAEQAVGARTPSPWPFSKMHGAGNDFIVLDLRDGRAPPTPAQCAAWAHRQTGVGCDQILTIEPPRTPQALAAYRVFNADGSLSGQCGNGARCVAAWLVRAGVAPKTGFMLDSPAGTHLVEISGDGQVQVNMGRPIFAPERIPLTGFETARSCYTFHLDNEIPIDAGALSMGNPHVVIEVPSLAVAPLALWGPKFQQSAYFPASVNVGVAEVRDAQHIHLRVYERGVGETLACGSGACAAAVSLIGRNRVRRKVDVHMRGGTVQIAWPDDDAEVCMRGPAVFVFAGELPP